jgi:hypothetical protein
MTTLDSPLSAAWVLQALAAERTFSPWQTAAQLSADTITTMPMPMFHVRMSSDSAQAEAKRSAVVSAQRDGVASLA